MKRPQELSTISTSLDSTPKNQPKMADNGDQNPEVQVESTPTTKKPDYAASFPTLGGPPSTAKPSWMTKKTAGPIKSLINNKIAAKRAGQDNNSITKTVTIPRDGRKLKNDVYGQKEMRSNCSAVSGKTGTRISYTVNKDESIQVIVQGKNQKSVESACMQIKGQLSAREGTEIAIAKQFHRFILGKQGTKLRALEEATGTRIRIPGPNDDDDKIKIEGPKEGVNQARSEIMKIARTQGERGNERLDIPKEYHPFIRGRKDEIIANCGGADVRINVPPTDKDEISISINGDKKGVILAKALVEAIYNKKKDKCTEVSVDVDKKSHRHVIGPKGAGIRGIFEKHDVLVEVPPADSKSESITLRGEPAHLGLALNEVYLMANSYTTVEIDAPRWCRPKFIGAKGSNIKTLQELHPKAKIDIKQDNDKIEVSGPLEVVDEAAKAIRAQIKQILTNFTVKEIKVPQSNHGRIIGNKGANLKIYQTKYEGLNIRLPNSSETSDIIKIEGRPEDVAEVYKEMLEQAAKFANEATESVVFEQKYHKFFFQKVDRSENAVDRISLIRKQYPESLNIQFPNRDSGSDAITVRGPKQFVAASIKDMKALYQEIVGNNYTGSVLIMKQFHRTIIGKGGASIQKIKGEFDVQIDIPNPDDDTQLIRITGKKENVEKCKQRLRKIESEQANIVEESVQISQKLHSQLIGKKGAQINELRAKYSVMIQFPDKGDKSDAVMIRGSEDQVKGAKAELSAIATVKLEEGYTESVECPAEHIKFMIGKGGKTKQELQEKFDVTLILPSKDSQEACLTVLGKEANVKNARAEIQKRLDILKETKEITVEVPKKFHVQFIRRGKNGNILSHLQADFAGTNIKVPKQDSEDEVFIINGPINCVEEVKKEILDCVERFENTAEITVELPCKNEDIRSLIGTQGVNINKVQDGHNVEIKIERAEAAEGEDISMKPVMAKLTGHKDHLEAAKAELIAMCPITKEYEMPSEYHGILLGQRGAGIRALCEELQITIKVPKKQENGETLNSITLKGTDDKLDNAVKVLDDRKAGYAKEAESRYLKSYQLELAVPQDFHSKLIGIGGEHITKLRDEFDVNIQMPDRSKGDSEIIKITGFQENAENAAKAVEAFCDNLMQYVIKDVQIENSVHRRIIGQRGRGVRKLMSDHQVDIKFPRNEDENKEMVRVSGPPSNVDEAIEALTALEEEFLQEVGEDDVYDTRYQPSVPAQQCFIDAEDKAKAGKRGGAKGSSYNAPKDAPWAGDFPLISNSGSGDATQGSWAGGKPAMRK